MSKAIIREIVSFIVNNDDIQPNDVIAFSERRDNCCDEEEYIVSYISIFNNPLGCLMDKYVRNTSLVGYSLDRLARNIVHESDEAFKALLDLLKIDVKWMEKMDKKAMKKGTVVAIHYSTISGRMYDVIQRSSGFKKCDEVPRNLRVCATLSLRYDGAFSDLNITDEVYEALGEYDEDDW
jgi:hypothetical protein